MKIYLTEGAAIGNKSTRFIETSTDWKSVKVGRNEEFHRFTVTRAQNDPYRPRRLSN